MKNCLALTFSTEAHIAFSTLHHVTPIYLLQTTYRNIQCYFSYGFSVSVAVLWFFGYSYYFQFLFLFQL